MPDALRGEFAVPGEWTVVSERVVDGEGNVQEERGLSTGVRKRKVDEEEEEQREAVEVITRKKGWGNTFRRFPGKMGEEEDLDELFGARKKVKREGEGDGEVKTEEGDVKGEMGVKEEPGVKEEESSKGLQDIPTEEEAAKAESEPPAPAVVFKKRKKIAR